MPRSVSNPGFVTPMAAQVAKTLPEGDEWLYELKLDGYRALIVKDQKHIELRSRNDKDLTAMYAHLASAAKSTNADKAVIDGEIVALDEHGRPSFQALQHRGSHPRHVIVYYAFDVLHVDGLDITGEPLSARRARLQKIVEPDAVIRLSRELPGTAPAVIAAVRNAGLEGIVAKRRGSPYQPGERSSDWVKLKLERSQEFVIGGYRADGSIGLDALLVGYYERKELRFAGKVRAGLLPQVRRELLGKLKSLHAVQCPFANLPDAAIGRWGGGVTAEHMNEMQWLTPELIAQVRFTEWTAEGRLRHAAFIALRSDKAPLQVVREP